jgi:hypothetical protein
MHGTPPSPRYGHATAVTGYILIVLGGHTDSLDGTSGIMDNKLYLYNLCVKCLLTALSSLMFTRQSQGAGPVLIQRDQNLEVDLVTPPP